MTALAIILLAVAVRDAGVRIAFAIRSARVTACANTSQPCEKEASD